MKRSRARIELTLGLDRGEQGLGMITLGFRIIDKARRDGLRARKKKKGLGIITLGLKEGNQAREVC